MSRFTTASGIPFPIMLSRIPMMLASHFVFGVAFALIYTRGYEDRKPPLGQGLRYGFLMWLATSVPWSLTQCFVYPISESLALSWIGCGLVQCLVIGAAVAMIYRPAPEAGH